MLTSAQRAYLRSLAQTMEPVLYIGYEGITPQVVRQADDALSARELIKCSVQRSVEEDVHAVCDALCDAVHADAVQCIGRKFVIYRMARQPEKRKIRLPRA